MTTELYWLTMTALMTTLFWAPYVLSRWSIRGLFTALADTGPETGSDQPIWAQRAIRAHQNAVENLVIFAPVVLVAFALNISTPVTKTAALVYFFARLAHFIVYTMGLPFLRTTTFTVAWACPVAIIASILHWI